MNSVIDILETLESDNSRNFKEDLLRKNSSNDLLKSVFVSTGNPYLNFFVNKFKMPAPSSGTDDDDNEVLENFLSLIIDELSTRKTTGNAAKALVCSAFNLMNLRQQKWCQRILLRNLRVGVMETTVNKVWPGSIVKFSVQLAEALDSHFEKDKGIIIDEEVKFPVRVEPKLDGLRCIAVKNNGVVTMFTRNGTVLETLPSIKFSIEAAPWDNFVLDGENMGSDWNESASVIMSRKNNKDDSDIKYHVFDAMHLDDWIDQNNETPLSERIDLAASLIEQMPEGSPVLHVEGKSSNNLKELLEFYSKTMEKGYEGIMLKKLNSPYVFKRSDAVLKLKPITTYEGAVVGHYEGGRGTKREGMWGGFEVLMPNGVITRVGGGFTDRLKAEIGIDPDLWIGRIVEVEGQPDPLTTDGLTRDGKIRFPVFIRERDSNDVDSKVTEAYDVYKKSILP